MNDVNTMENLSYAGLRHCGCVEVLTSCLYRKRAARMAAGMALRGLRLRIVTTDEARTLPWSCPLCRPQEVMALTETIEKEIIT